MKIETLSIYTSRIEEQVSFYKDILNLDLINFDEYSATFKIGYSVLKLIYREKGTSYHIAINIPSEKDTEALSWLKQRVDILKFNDEEVIRFDDWNARSIYFYDEDKNIIELIARRNLGIVSRGEFDSSQLIGISEIGMPVENIEKAFKDINDIRKTSLYDGSFNLFCAAGDEYGLFIIVDRNKKKWFPTNDQAFSSDFIIDGGVCFEFKDGMVKRLINK